MTQNNKASRRILSSHYFLYFGVFGIFLPYFNLYLFHIGLDSVQIGAVSGVRSAAVVATPLLWGILADRTRRRKLLFVVCNFASTGLFALYFTATSFFPLLAATVAYSLFYAPIISFMEAFSMEILGRDRNRYGQVRVWGTLAFVGTALVMGRIVQTHGVGVILWLIFGGSLLLALVSLVMPESTSSPGGSRLPSGKDFFRKEVVLFQAAAFLMLFSHGAYYGFYSIHLEKLGYSPTFIGIAWALASVAEMGVMVFSNRILGRFHPVRILQFSLGAAVLRWAVMAVAESPLALMGAQALHAATYASFHVASIVYMEQLIPPRARTAGQAVNNSMTYGLGMMAGFFVSGFLFDGLGPRAAFGASAAAAALGGTLLLSRKPGAKALF